MDLFRGLLCSTESHNEDCNATEEEIPHMNEFFQKMEPGFLVAICVGMIATGIVLILGIVHWVFVLKFISNEQIRTDLYWLVFMGPVVSLCGAMGLLLPRAAIFLYAIALVYFMICIFVLVCLMSTLNGSRQAMCEKLSARGVKISLKVCPIGCCFFCLPKIETSQLNFRRIEWLVFQSPIVRIFLEVLNIIIFMEINSRTGLFFQLSNLIGIISLFIGSYGSYMVIPAGASLLKEYRFLLLFRLVDFSQLAWSVQKFVFEFLAFPRLKVFSTETFLPATAKAQFCISFLLCLEMLIVSLLATWMFRPTKTWLFDKFRHGVGLAGGRGCRIADSSFLDDTFNGGGCQQQQNGGGGGPIRFFDDDDQQQQQQAATLTMPKYSNGNGSLRLEQVRLNGSGHTVITSAPSDMELDATSQRRLFLQQQRRPRAETAETTAEENEEVPKAAASSSEEEEGEEEEDGRNAENESPTRRRSPPAAAVEFGSKFGSQQSTVSGASTNSSDGSSTIWPGEEKKERRKTRKEEERHQQRQQQNPRPPIWSVA